MVYKIHFRNMFSIVSKKSGHNITENGRIKDVLNLESLYPILKRKSPIKYVKVIQSVWAAFELR